ncbi:MAG TPA: hypothetical protein VI357_21840 [Mycobacteriales bacterium]
MREFDGIPALAAALDAVGYLPDDGVATAAYLAHADAAAAAAGGDPGVGTTALAQALASLTGSTFVRLSC